MKLLKIVTQTDSIETGKPGVQDNWMDDCAWSTLACAVNHLTDSNMKTKEAVAIGESVGRKDRDGLPDPTSLAQLVAGAKKAGIVARYAKSWDDVLKSMAAGAVIGIHPFDQPDVEASKVETRALTDAYERDGHLPAEKHFFEEDGVLLYADAQHSARLRQATGADAKLVDVLRAHLATAGRGDYVGLLAYLDMDGTRESELARMRSVVRHHLRTATCVGFGPRFLHSTGQAYKGGPNSGVFLQVTCVKTQDTPVPGRPVSFGVVQAAQARGDLAVLQARGRRALRVHLPDDSAQSVARLRAALESALKAVPQVTR